MAHAPDLRLPPRWPDTVKSGVLHAIALAGAAVEAVRDATRGPRRLAARLHKAEQDIELLKEELAIKDERWRRSRTRRRPHYRPDHRLRILELRAARGWTLEHTARTFLVDLHTLQLWIARVDEPGESALVRPRTPINRYPDFVRHAVRSIKRLVPALGDEAIAGTLASCGLVLSATTVRRMVREPFEPRDDDDIERPTPPRRAVARRPGDVWHVDLTAVPTRAGFWVPWFPHTLPQRAPWSWWIAAIVDQWSRRIVGHAVFRKLPTSEQMQRVLDRAIASQGFAPRCVVSDRGSQFKCASYRRWCTRRGVLPRYGHLGEPSSIPIVERFMRTLKDGCFRRILIPVTAQGVHRELHGFATWYNRHRPHTHLDGRTPDEVYFRRRRRRRRLEPRPGYRTGRRRDKPDRFTVVIEYVDGKKHLPIIELKRVA